MMNNCFISFYLSQFGEFKVWWAPTLQQPPNLMLQSTVPWSDFFLITSFFNPKTYNIFWQTCYEHSFMLCHIRVHSVCNIRRCECVWWGCAFTVIVCQEAFMLITDFICIQHYAANLGMQVWIEHTILCGGLAHSHIQTGIKQCCVNTNYHSGIWM